MIKGSRRDKVFSRSEKLQIKVTPGELSDLRMVADAWDVTVRELMWYFVAQPLAKMRNREMMDVGYPIETADVIEMIEDQMEAMEDAGDGKAERVHETQQDAGVPGKEGMEPE